MRNVLKLCFLRQETSDKVLYRSFIKQDQDGTHMNLVSELYQAYIFLNVTNCRNCTKHF